MARPVPDDIKSGYPLLLRALGEPTSMLGLTATQWTRLVSVARQAQLLARLAELARRDGIFDRIPEAPARHLDAAGAIAEKHHRDVRWELSHLRHSLAHLPGPVVVLKGASYVVSGVSARLGRTFGDIDILVPRDQLDDAEQALIVAGWQCSKDSAYDIQYYRRWTHQLAPMRHATRQSTIDLHHALRPPIAPGKVDTQPLFAAARATEFGFSIPCPTDMIIHSAGHLFYASDFRNGLRDLSDIDLMLKEFAVDDAWWTELVQRSQLFGLAFPVAMALLHAKRTLSTPVPSGALAAALKAAGRGEHSPLDFLVRQILPPATVSRTMIAGAARTILFARGYLLDMPPRVLAAHLSHKLLGLIPKRRPSDLPQRPKLV